jgi:hypothetical protein
MSTFKPLVTACLLLAGVVMFVPGCVVAPVEPHEGYYDRDHHRWYHEHTWHECVEHDIHCHHDDD